MDKAREKYERKCQEAIEITASMKKSDNATVTDANSPSSDSTSDDISSSKELTDKLAAGAGQLLTKMWDTTSAFGRNPLERQRSKLYGCLEEVIAAEKHYVQTVEYTNAQRLIFEREIKENLHAFQLTEEQRLDLGSQEEVDVDRADLSINPFYLRMTHIQAMSDNGQRMIGVINAVVTEFISSEARFSQALRKLLRTHESGGLTPPSDLFGTSSSNMNLNFLADEGATMANGWLTVKDQVKLLLEVHQEFQSLLAEPVSLSLATMKSEYESVRVSTQEHFLKAHSTLCSEAAAHKRLQHKLDVKSRDFAVTFSYMPGSTSVSTNSYGIEVTQALKVLSSNLRLFNEKERRSEAKLRQLAEEIRLLQVQVSESSKSLRRTTYTVISETQEIEVFISTCMKNEKYRLQVGKNSLQSMAKAVEHMLQGGTSVGNKALVEFQKIDPNEDISEFIRINRQPYERSKRIVPAYHCNDSLKEVMRDYLSSLGASSDQSDKNPRSPSSSCYPAGSISSGDLITSPEKSPRLMRTSSAVLVKNDQTMPTNDNITDDEGHLNEDENSRSGMEQDEEFSEAQPLGVSDFQKKFKVMNYKPPILLETEALMSDRQTETGLVESIGVTDNSTADGETRRRRSSNELAAVAPSPELNSANAEDVMSAEDSRPPSSLPLENAAPPATPVIPQKDDLLSEFDLMLDEEVAFSVDTAFSKLWIESDNFSRCVLDSAGSTNVSMPPWEKKSVSYTAVSMADTFDGSRLVSYTHNKKYMVGPSVIPTAQTQRYSYIPGSRLIVSTTTCVSDVPYCDYFHVEHRWVFSATKTQGACLVQIGLRIQWSKKAKDAVKSWLNAAIEATKLRSSVDRIPTSANPVSLPSTKPSLCEGKQEEKTSKEYPQQVLTAPVLTSATLTQPAPTPTSVGLQSQLHPILQAAIIICALMFIYTMYRVCATMGQMEALTRESLIQQRQQQELLKQLLAKQK
ncbi:unnamed protein product [Phytophthora fragariaefolia]|uniref:Unnamed protein product n=1 Tax=Phytophthora fragariaefolia TaxID=1490495 RepID=A0A9W6XEU2_9STRA|nr:unnamed protein product [Phytophthora fragariaefolia]